MMMHEQTMQRPKVNTITKLIGAAATVAVGATVIHNIDSIRERMSRNEKHKAKLSNAVGDVHGSLLRMKEYANKPETLQNSEVKDFQKDIAACIGLLTLTQDSVQKDVYELPDPT
jgi:hypothetical protein